MAKKLPFLSRWLQRQLDREVRTALSESDSFFALGSHGSASEMDRYTPDRDQLLRDALEAWRVNPLARRIVGLTSQYVVGGGLSIRADHPATHRFIADWFHH